jgi:hypothetical protein
MTLKLFMASAMTELCKKDRWQIIRKSKKKWELLFRKFALHNLTKFYLLLFPMNKNGMDQSVVTNVLFQEFSQSTRPMMTKELKK